MRNLDTVMGDMGIIFPLYYGMCVCRRIARYLLSAMYTQEKFEDTKEVLWSQCGIQIKRGPRLFHFVRPLPIPQLHHWKKMEVCLINFNKGEDGEVFKNPQYSEMECNCVRKITKGLFRKYNLYCESISVKVQ